MEKIINAIIVVTAFLGMLIYNVVSWGYVTMLFYKWFIFDKFANMPVITTTQFIGLSLFFAALLPKTYGTTKENKDNAVAIVFLAPWGTLLIGWLLYVIVIH